MANSDGLDAIAHPTVLSPNLLDSYGKGQDIAGKIWENRLYQARQAAGQNFLNSIRPDGTTDQNMLLQGAKNTPGMALAAQSSAQAGQTLSTEEYGQQMKRLTAGAAGFGQILVDNNGTAPYEAVKQYYDRAVKDGHVTQAQEDAVMSGFGPDPVQNASVGRQRMMQSIQTQEALSRANGTPSIQDVGGQKIPGMTNSQTGAFAPAGPPLKNTTSPAQKISPVTGPASPTGGATTISAEEYARSRGLDPNTGDPLPNPAFKDIPATLRGPNQAPPAVIPPTATGVGPATSAALTETGGTSSKAYEATSQAGVKAISQRALLQNMAGDATQFTTGPGASTIKQTKAVIQRVAGVFGLSPIDADKLAANEDLDKVAAQLADAQGAGSDARLAVNQGANPTSHNTPAGLKLILNKLTGNADYLAARAQLAAQYQRTQDPTGEHVREFEAKVGKDLDPRVFQFNRLDGDQKKQYLSEMSDQKARDAFKMSYFKHRDLGVFPGG